MKHNIHLTARPRNAPSLPAQWLFDNNRVLGEVLDFGSGRGFDAEYYGMDEYDIYYAPEKPDKLYDTILCTYVINTLPPEEEENVLKELESLLQPLGVCYITVRRDTKRDGYTKRGTYQRLAYPSLPIIYENSSFCIYFFMKGMK